MRWTIKADLLELVLIGAIVALGAALAGKVARQNARTASEEPGSISVDPPDPPPAEVSE